MLSRQPKKHNWSYGALCSVELIITLATTKPLYWFFFWLEKIKKKKKKKTIVLKYKTIAIIPQVYAAIYKSKRPNF